MSNPVDSRQTVYVIPENIAYVHSEEFAKYSPTATYLANLANGELSVLQDSASIIWSIFEDPMPLQDAIDVLCEMYEQPIETMGPQIEGFIPELLSKGLLEAR